MFPYDGQLAAVLVAQQQSIPGVLQVMHTIDNTCIAGDGLKWFNWLYLQVTQAMAIQVAAGGCNDAAWLSTLDVQFAAFYFNALEAALAGAPCPGCWSAMFSVRNQTAIARIQFALAGMNAHINHDLAMAIMATCEATGTAPRHGSNHYNDYTALNTTMDALIDTAKQTLKVRLLGDPLPPVSHLEDTIAAWNLAAAREQAWNTAQALWQEPPAVATAHMDIISGLTTVISKALVVPVPL